jgi:hypothetical protein
LGKLKMTPQRNEDRSEYEGDVGYGFFSTRSARNELECNRNPYGQNDSRRDYDRDREGYGFFSIEDYDDDRR